MEILGKVNKYDQDLSGEKHKRSRSENDEFKTISVIKEVSNFYLIIKDKYKILCDLEASKNFNSNVVVISVGVFKRSLLSSDK